MNIEVQNSASQLRGRSATRAGKPDLIAQRDGQAVLVDVKTGQESASHVVQVVICLYAIPRALRRYRTLKLNGQVTYQDHTTRISAEAVDNQVIQKSWNIDPQTRGPNTRQASTQPAGTPVLRHHRRRLPGPDG